ncbi:MAG: vitamin K epoxide reductase family protein [bacterium]|nr:vitamin K epoxide reductase family protein [bacterium]
MTKTGRLHNRLIFLLSLVGLTISGYLFYTYVRQTPILCVNSGCELVRASGYSYFLSVPLPAYGGLMYLGIFITSFSRTLFGARFFQTSSKVILVLASAGVAVSAYLTYLEAFKIKAFCIWCLASAVVILFLFLTSAFEVRRLNEN